MSTDYSLYWKKRMIANTNTQMPRHKRVVDVILSHFTSGTVLDVGCGIPHILSSLPDTFEKYACDVTKTVATLVGSDIHFSVVNLNNSFPAWGLQYDVVVATEVLEHLENPLNVLLNVPNVLRDDGLFISTIPNPVNILHRLELLRGKVPSWDVTHIQKWTMTEYKNLLEKHGYIIQSITPTYAYIRPMKFVVRFPSLYNLFGDQFLFVCTYGENKNEGTMS